MNEAKRLLILTANAGFGHRSAAKAIAAALQETHPDDCVVEVINPMEDARVPSFLTEGPIDHDRLVRQIPELYKFGYETSDATVPGAIVESALAVMLFEVMRETVQRYRPDAVLTTYPLYQAPLDAVRRVLRRFLPLLTVVTDLTTVHRLWFHRAADVCLVPTPAVHDLAVKYGLSREKVHITGIPVHPAFAREQGDKAALRARLNWRPDVVSVLAVGSRRVRNLREVLHALNHAHFPVQLAVVAGGDDALYGDLQRVEWHVPTYLFNFVQDMPMLMHAADCVVTKAGGLIISEALACGLPLLLIDVNPGQEVGNAEYVAAGAAGDLAQGPLHALEIMYHWLDGGGTLMFQRARNARSLGRARAAYAIADLAYAEAERASPAKPRRKLLQPPRLAKLLKPLFGRK